MQPVAKPNLARRLVERVDTRRRRFVARVDHARPQHPIAGQFLDVAQHSPFVALTKRRSILVAERLLHAQFQRVAQHRWPRERERQVRCAVGRAEELARQRFGRARPHGVQVRAAQRRHPGRAGAAAAGVSRSHVSVLPNRSRGVGFTANVIESRPLSPSARVLSSATIGTNRSATSASIVIGASVVWFRSASTSNRMFTGASDGAAVRPIRIERPVADRAATGGSRRDTSAAGVPAGAAC